MSLEIRKYVEPVRILKLTRVVAWEEKKGMDCGVSKRIQINIFSFTLFAAQRIVPAARANERPSERPSAVTETESQKLIIQHETTSVLVAVAVVGFAIEVSWKMINPPELSHIFGTI